MKMRKTIILALFAMLTIGQVGAQDSNYARYIINNLTAGRMHGRGASYRGDSVAALFIRNELKRYGLKGLGADGDFYQPYTYNTHSMEGDCRITIDGKALVPYEQYRVAPFSKSVHNSLGVNTVVRVPVETLIDTDALKKFLVVHKGALQNAVLYLDLTTFKAKDAERQKVFESAVSNLNYRNPFGSSVLILGKEKLGTASLGLADREHDYALVEMLASAMPKKMKDINMDISTQYRPGYRTKNVWGLVPGESDSMVVFCAHYDHLGMMGDSVVFPGAHDNASGVAAVLELARSAVKEKPKYTMVFVFFSGEEAGLKGSRYAAEHSLVDLSKVRLLVNLDMFCGGDEGLMVFNANDVRTKPFVDRLEMLNNALNIIPEIRKRDNRPNSDHYYFSKQCPALYFLTMGGPYGGYHDPADVSSGCGLGNFVNYLTLISSLAL